MKYGPATTPGQWPHGHEHWALSIGTTGSWCSEHNKGETVLVLSWSLLHYRWKDIKYKAERDECDCGQILHNTILNQIFLNLKMMASLMMKCHEFWISSVNFSHFSMDLPPSANIIKSPPHSYHSKCLFSGMFHNSSLNMFYFLQQWFFFDKGGKWFSFNIIHEVSDSTNLNSLITLNVILNFLHNLENFHQLCKRN